MTANAQAMYAGLPPTVREDRSVEGRGRVEARRGSVAILLTGGVARGDYRPGESDITAIVVVRDASFAKLDAISAATQDARATGAHRSDVPHGGRDPGAGDAFPLLYDDQALQHRHPRQRSLRAGRRTTPIAASHRAGAPRSAGLAPSRGTTDAMARTRRWAARWRARSVRSAARSRRS